MGLELDAIAAVVLGGASLMGGTGSVLLIGGINNDLGLLNVPIEAQLIAKGLITIAGLAASYRET